MRLGSDADGCGAQCMVHTVKIEKGHLFTLMISSWLEGKPGHHPPGIMHIRIISSPVLGEERDFGQIIEKASLQVGLRARGHRARRVGPRQSCRGGLESVHLRSLLSWLPLHEDEGVGTYLNTKAPPPPTSHTPVKDHRPHPCLGKR